MNTTPAPPPRPGRTSRLAHAALALYPATWRARYEDEVRALLEDSGADLRTVASLVGRAVTAWAWPPRHLYDRPARMRASLGTVLVAWTAAVGLALTFAQLTQAQGVKPPGHPVIGWLYWIFDGTLALSVLAVAVGGLPLWGLLLRRAHREHRPRETAWLLAPVAAPAAYLAVLAAGSRLADPADGVGPWWFLVIVLAGFGAGGVAAAGPVLALRRLKPRGPALTLATRAAGVAAGAIAVAGAASIAAAAGLSFWSPQYAGYHEGWPLGVYVPLVVLAVCAATVSAARGIRAGRPAGGG
jgi:hypothetical protein